MQGRPFDAILTGTAIALVLSLSAPSAWAQNQLDQQAIEALVPMPVAVATAGPPLPSLPKPLKALASTVTSSPVPVALAVAAPPAAPLPTPL